MISIPRPKLAVISHCLISMILEISLLLLSDNHFILIPDAVFALIKFESTILKNFGFTILMELPSESVKKQLLSEIVALQPALI